MRKTFADELYKAMQANDNIWLLVGDLGYRMFDRHLADFSKRCINCGASEQAMMGIAVGLAQSGKIPFVYSITPFLLYRPFETIRNYINHEQLPVQLVGSGLYDDYRCDGFSHHCFDVKESVWFFSNIRFYLPESKEEIAKIATKMARGDKPRFLGLRR